MSVEGVSETRAEIPKDAYDASGAGWAWSGDAELDLCTNSSQLSHSDQSHLHILESLVNNGNQQQILQDVVRKEQAVPDLFGYLDSYNQQPVISNVLQAPFPVINTTQSTSSNTNQIPDWCSYQHVGVWPHEAQTVSMSLTYGMRCQHSSPIPVKQNSAHFLSQIQMPNMCQPLPQDLVHVPTTTCQHRAQIMHPCGYPQDVQQLQVHNVPAYNRPQHSVISTQTQKQITRTIKKRKRVRTAFTTDQILALEKVFQNQSYVSRTERQQLSRKLKLQEKAIKVWFQNRRMKGKRDSQNFDDYEEVKFPISEPSSEESEDLDTIDAQIQIDDSGFVRLDDNLLDKLMKVLNTKLPHDIELAVDATSSNEPDFNNQAEYEPVSPADTFNHSTERIEPWEPPESEQALRRLFEVHFC